MANKTMRTQLRSFFCSISPEQHIHGHPCHSYSCTTCTIAIAIGCNNRISSTTLCIANIIIVKRMVHYKPGVRQLQKKWGVGELCATSPGLHLLFLCRKNMMRGRPGTEALQLHGMPYNYSLSKVGGGAPWPPMSPPLQSHAPSIYRCPLPPCLHHMHHQH